MKCLVLDYGGTFIKYSVMDEQKNRYEKGEGPAPIDTLENFIQVTKALYGQFRGQVEGVTISFPGFVDSETTFLSGGGAYYNILINRYLKEIFEECIDVPFVIENDGKCGALAEAWGGALAGATCGAVVIFGTGIAGGLLQNGKIYKGGHATAGELSYLTLDWNMPMSGAAQFRCSASALISKVAVAKGYPLKNFASLYVNSGVAAGWKHAEPDPALADQEMDGFKVFELLAAGDPDVVEIYDVFCKDVASMLRSIQCIFDPERIAIGGGISRQDRLVLDIEKAFLECGNYLTDMLPKPEIVRCQYQGDANQYGAMYHYLTKYHPEML